MVLGQKPINSLLQLLQLGSLLQQCWLWIHGSILCTGTCTTTSFCIDTSILYITALLSPMHLELCIITPLRGFLMTQLAEPYLFSFPVCLPESPSSSFPLPPSKQWMTTVDYGFLETSSTCSSKTTLPIMISTINFMGANTTLHNHSS